MIKKEIIITLRGVTPDTTPMSELGALLTNLERAILVATSHEGIQLPDEAVASLVEIFESSNGLKLAVAEPAIWAASEISQAVANEAFEELPYEVNEALHEISNQAVRRSWAMEFQEDPQLRIASAEISEAHPVPSPSMATAEGTTTLYGRCVRVGGATRPRAEIRVANGQLKNIDLSEGLAKALAKRLYEEVCIEGQATWRTDTWSLESFIGKRLTEFRSADPVDGFRRLATASRGCWDDVDAEEYVRQMRS